MFTPSKDSAAYRPAEVSEQTVRPLDAYGALRYLRTRADIIADRIGFQGWSNGAMTVLATMSRQSPGRPASPDDAGFRTAIAEYPGCGMDAIHGAYQAYAPFLMMIAGADEEVSPQRCESFARTARDNGRATRVCTYLLAVQAINRIPWKLEDCLCRKSPPRTTGLYDRRGDEISLAEVERIVI